MKLVCLLSVLAIIGGGGPTDEVPPFAAALIAALEARYVNVVQQLGLANNATNADAFNNPVTIPTVNTLGQPTLEDALYYMLFSGAAYCFNSHVLTSWTCKYCRATGPSVSLHSTLFNLQTRIAGLVNLNDDKKAIVVTFRGSYTTQNFIADLEIDLVPWIGVNEDVRVHKGFLRVTNSIYDQVLSNLMTLTTAHPDYKIVVGGHSLGSAVATLTLIRLLKTEPQFQDRASDFSLFAYGPPRVGDVAFAQWANSLRFNCARIVHYADIVAHIAPASTGGYIHFGTEYWINPPFSNQTRICRGDVLEDPACSNSLAPAYDETQHLSYYGITPLQCVKEDPLNAFLQFI